MVSNTIDIYHQINCHTKIECITLFIDPIHSTCRECLISWTYLQLVFNLCDSFTQVSYIFHQVSFHQDLFPNQEIWWTFNWQNATGTLNVIIKAQRIFHRDSWLEIVSVGISVTCQNLEIITEYLFYNCSSV